MVFKGLNANRIDEWNLLALRFPRYARDLRSTVRQWVGIPTCIGIGPTKTLAKLANKIAKGIAELGGVCDLTDEEIRAHWLVRMPVSEVWGIGRASASKLERLGMESVADLAAMDLRHARQLLTVTGEKIVHELRGNSCMPLELVAAQQKGCAVTRSFSQRITDLPMMLEAVATHASRLGEKLRKQGHGRRWNNRGSLVHGHRLGRPRREQRGIGTQMLSSHLRPSAPRKPGSGQTSLVILP